MGAHRPGATRHVVVFLRSIRGSTPRCLATGLRAGLRAGLGACLLVGAGVTPAVALWPASSVRTAAVDMAQFRTALTKVSGEGTVTASSYTLNGLVTPQAGTLKLTNTSTAPAVMKVDYRLANLVADATIASCPRPWAADGTCAGATTLADSRLLGGPTGTYTWPSALAPGAELNLRVSLTGVTGGVTLSTTAVAARTTPADRTLG